MMQLNRQESGEDVMGSEEEIEDNGMLVH